MSYPLVKLSSIGKSKSGATPSRAKQTEYFSAEGTPWVKTLDLNNGIITSTSESVTDLAIKETSITVFPVGTLLIAMYGGYNQIGRTGLLEIEATTNQAITGVKLDDKKIMGYYALQSLNHFRFLWRRYAASSRKDPNITRDDVDAFKIPLPPLPTQNRIAAILQTWDRAIQLAEQQLEDLQNRKRGLMQLLLTGKKRLPEFEGDTKWEKIEFDKLAYRVTDRFNPKQDSSNLECVELEHISQNTGVRLGSITAENISSMKTLYKRNDILFGKLRPYLNKFWFATNDGMCSTEIWALRPVNAELITSNYLYLLVQSERFQSAVNQTSGSKMPRADWNVLSKDIFTIPPSTEEQESIFDLVNMNDNHQSSTIDTISSLRLQKRGLMQRLLEGEVEVGEDIDKILGL